MLCFTAQWLTQLCIWAVIIGATYAIIRVVLPMILANLGGPDSAIGRIIEIGLRAFLRIVVIYIAFDLVSCLIGMGGGLRLPGARYLCH